MNTSRVLTRIALVFFTLSVLLGGFFLVTTAAMNSSDGANIGGGVALLLAVPVLLLAIAFEIGALIIKNKNKKSIV